MVPWDLSFIPKWRVALALAVECCANQSAHFHGRLELEMKVQLSLQYALFEKRNFKD
jgi:hypothetical protein